MDLEQSLRAALRPVEPGADFAAAVATRITVQARQRRRARWRVPVALAASLLVAAIGLTLLQQQRDAERAASARQLAMALEITSAQLNHIQQKLNRNEDEENGI